MIRASRKQHRIACSLGLAVAMLGLCAAPAAAAPSFEVDLQRDMATVNHSDERLDYAVTVKNLSSAGVTPSVGSPLLCAGAHPIQTWAPITDRPVNGFQWLRDGVAIPGATSLFYTATAADAGKAIQCIVSGANGAATSVSVSVPAVAIDPQPAVEPPRPHVRTANDSRPTIAGTGSAERTCTPPAGWSITATATTTAGSANLTAVATAKGTGTTANGSSEVTGVATTAGGFAVGQTISITGSTLAAGTTITAISGTTLTLSNPVTAGGGANKAITAGSQPFEVGQAIVGLGIPAGTTITAVSGQTMTISNPVEAALGGANKNISTPGTWSYQWLRNGEPIAGATSNKYTPQAADQGKILQCRVNGTNVGGTVGGVSNNSIVGTVTGPPVNGAANNPIVIPDPTTVTLELPAGEETFAYEVKGSGWVCSKEPSTSGQPARATCAGSQSIAIGVTYPTLTVVAALDPESPDLAVATATVTGGGTPEPATDTDEFTFEPAIPFSITGFEANVFDELGNDYTQAGGHPFTAFADFAFSTGRGLTSPRVPVGHAKEVVVDAPRGFVGNALAVPEICPSVEEALYFTEPRCPRGSVVGHIVINPAGSGSTEFESPIYAVEPEFGAPIMFAFGFTGTGAYTFIPRLRAEDGYAISFEAAPAVAEPPLLGVEVMLCGYGGKATENIFEGCKAADDPTANPKPLITNPTRCSGPPPTTRTRVNTWKHPEQFASNEFSAPQITGCEQVEFEPKAKLVPTNNRADSPTGLDVEITMPTDGLESKEGISQANLDNATVTFPKGMSINPAAADGLSACTPAQIKMGSNADDECPESSKVGTVSVETPLIKETLAGDVYVAAQRDNPFDSTLGLYLVFSSPRDGITIKVAGKLETDPLTGQITSKFVESPEAPFSKLVLSFNEGPRAPLINPPKCGTYAIHSEFSPWSAVNPANPTADEVVAEETTFEVSEGPNGGPCPPGSLEPKLQARLRDNQAGSKSPFVLRLSREDGTQRFSGLKLAMPPGLTAYLKGVSNCPEHVLAGISEAELTGRGELASPACPAASQVGTVRAGAGAGPFPLWAPGRVYLAGPYKSAPLSLVTVVPAVAGPFDLGSVTVRNALYVDPVTSQVSVVSDPIPTILHGILLNVRDIRVEIDRPGFTAAPTSCEPMSIDAEIKGEGGSSAAASNRFQAGGCEALGFKPKLSMRLFGGTKRGANPKFRAILRPRPGDANIARASVALPRSAFLDQAHIRTICTRVQFAADQCPAAAVYGHAEATTPLLDHPLSGPVYLRSSDNPLPDLVAVLRGPEHQPLEVNAIGRVDSIRGGIRTTFDIVPDQPVSEFTLTMQGGRKGLLVNSRDVCAGKPARARVAFGAHNGGQAILRPKLQNSCPKQRKAKKGKRSAKHAR